MTGPNLPIPTPGMNAIGRFDIGISPIGDIVPFSFWETVISQYANSPILTQLIGNFQQYLDQTANFDSLYDNIWNIATAQGYGLDVWGRIVGVPRTINVPNTNYFGTTEGGWQPFGQAAFYSGILTTNNIVLSDSAYRILILAKAMANISDGSIPSINQIMLATFPFRGNAYVIDNENMTMAYAFQFQLTPVEYGIIVTGVLPKPTGVAATIIQNLASGSTWDPTNVGPHTSLSGGNLIINVAGNTLGLDAGAQSNSSYISGKFYFEYTFVSQPLVFTGIGVGPSLSGQNLATTPFPGFGNSGALPSNISYSASGHVAINNVRIATIASYSSPGQVACIAVDLVNQQVWFRVNNGIWNGSALANPATNIGGFSLPVPAGTPVFVQVDDNNVTMTSQVNFGASAFAQPIPAGFLPWGTLAPPGTTWDPATVDPQVSLNPMNNVATVSGNPLGTKTGCRTNSFHSNGKFYLEWALLSRQFSDIGFGEVACGFGSIGLFGNFVNIESGCGYFADTGNVFVLGNLVATLTPWPVAGSGVVCCALDLVMNRIWFRYNAGFWNGSAANDPFINIGGFDITGITLPLYHLTRFKDAGPTSLLGNWGNGTAFAFLAPEGFRNW